MKKRMDDNPRVLLRGAHFSIPWISEFKKAVRENFKCSRIFQPYKNEKKNHSTEVAFRSESTVITVNFIPSYIVPLCVAGD